jgi:two-component system cell cycle response regulator
MIRLASKDVIEGMGYDYIESTGLEDTYDILNNNSIDLIITGLELDHIDGESLIESLSKSDFSSIPIVVLTSYDNLEIRTKLFKLGVVDYLIKKNFNGERLKSYIESIRLDEELTKAMSKLKVAVIDDSILTVKVIQNIFELNNISHVDYFYDARVLLSSPLDYDIYIIDLVLPETTGEMLISEIKKINTDCIIIMISSTSNYKTISHTLNSGADDFIVKPFDNNTFLVRIKHHLKQHMLLKELENKNAELLKLSITDGLTRIYNHNYIVNRLEEECSRADRYSETVSIMLLDLDNFKSVNDTFGHQVGDKVLFEVASTIKSVLRQSDILGRYGGEEFLVILPNTDEVETKAVGEKIREAVSCIENLATGLQVTISGGLATNHGFSYRQMIKEADFRLLEAKKTGKNKIV